MTTRTLLPASLTQRLNLRLVLGLVAAFALALAAALMAQVSGDRGIPPVASSTDIEVRGIEVNVTGDNPEDARSKGWVEATRKAWEKIDGPELPDARLESLVSAIVVEAENIGPRRYVARLGVIFDRQRAGPLLGGGGDRARSAPMLLIPVMMSGGTATTFETRNAWQRAWAEYQFGSSAIDYVRPVGSGSDSLLLTFGQTGRRSRAWWNNLLDQFGAADVLVPIADLRHEWPGGPVVGTFTARYGPDDRYLGEFTMRAENDEQLPRMLVRAVEQFNTIYTRALAEGALRPDPTLELDGFEMTPEIRALLEEARAAEAAEAAAEAAAARALAEGEVAAPEAAGTPVAPSTDTPAAAPTSYTVQIATPNASAFDAALGAVRSTPGVSASAVTSTAIGGTSVLRVTFTGSLSDFAAALRARGWQVTEGTGALSITR
ncbi:heavy-metal-associated domain-containing protein [Aurantiacibacter flavus]|uniref:Heavy-metal-associated domain-containing protein n=1 Tax=Aurantiacibacter flavus TaxID=3145232 RepID=A0ABV0CW61_9SPHN